MADKGWALVADGSLRRASQSRSTVAAVRALALGGYRAAVTVSGGRSWAAASRYCSRRVPVPAINDPAYAPAVRTEMDEHGYVAVLCATDAALLALGAPVRHFLEKDSLTREAEAAGLRVPPTLHFEGSDELVAAASDLAYPVVVKPTVRRDSPYLARSPKGLVGRAALEGPVIVQPYVAEASRSIAGLLWKGRLIASAHQRHLRIWPPDLGNACAAVTTKPDLELEDKLERLLDGYDGIFQAQMLGPYLLDIHPRVYASHSLAVAAGVNLVAMYCDLARGAEFGVTVRARPGVFFRWLEGDLRHVYRQLRRKEIGLGSALGALRPRRGSAHSTESLTDPGPMLMRLWNRTRGPAVNGRRE